MLPGSIMLLLAAADLEESQQNFEGMKAVYESYMGSYEEKREAEKAAAGEGTIVKMMDDDTSVVYAEYIRACRRSDSQASSRKAFLRARKAPDAAGSFTPPPLWWNGATMKPINRAGMYLNSVSRRTWTYPRTC